MLLAAWYHTISSVLFAFLCVLLIGVILLQRGRGGGLSGAFGGVGGAASTAFGSKTGDILTWITVGMALVFLLFAVGLNYMFRPPAAPTPLPTQVTPTPASSTPVAPIQAPASTNSPAPASETPTSDTPTPDTSTPDTTATDTPATETPASDTTESETPDAPAPAPSDEGTWLLPDLPPVAAVQIFGADAI